MRDPCVTSVRAQKFIFSLTAAGTRYDVSSIVVVKRSSSSSSSSKVVVLDVLVEA
jgi:hypothetical protein